MLTIGAYMEKTVIQTGNTEQAILEAAERLFLEKGYRRATTTAIAAEAGVTHAMLHYYFRTKEHIFLKILDKNMNEMLDSLSTAMSPALSVWEILREVVCLHHDFLCRHPKLPFLILDVMNDSPELLERYKDRVLGAVSEEAEKHRGRFRAEVEAGRINDVDPVVLVFSLLWGNVSRFLCLPAMGNVLKMPESQIMEFIGAMKEESLKALYARLFYKDMPEKI